MIFSCQRSILNNTISLLLFFHTTLQQVQFGSGGSSERDLLQGGEQTYVHFLLDIYCWRSLTACRVRSRLDNFILAVFIVRSNLTVSVDI